MPTAPMPFFCRSSHQARSLPLFWLTSVTGIVPRRELQRHCRASFLAFSAFFCANACASASELA